MPNPGMRSTLLTVLSLSMALPAWGAEPSTVPGLVTPASPPSQSASGASASPRVSGDGQTVVFTSDASNLAAGDTQGKLSDVFARDLAAGTTELISVATNGLSGNGPSSSPVVSADGRFVAFVSTASNLVPDDTNDVSDIFVRDRTASVTVLVSVARNSAASGSGPSDCPVLTPDGRFVGFQSWSTNLVSGDFNGHPDLFRRDLQSGITTLISIRSTRSSIASLSNGASRSLALSADGSRAVFLSAARNLAPAPRGNETGLFFRDLAAGTNRMIDLLPLTAANQKSIEVRNPTLSADGRWVAVHVSPPASFGPAGMFHIHLGTVTNTLERVAPTLNTRTPFPKGSDSSRPFLSEDGQTVVFEARRGSASTLIIPNNLQDPPAVYAWSPGSEPTVLSTNLAMADPRFGARPMGEVLAASDTAEFVAYSGYQPSAIEPTPGAPLNLWVVHHPTLETRRLTRAEFSDDAPQPSFSANGRRIAFVSADPRLVPGDLNNAPDVFLYDWDSQQLELVSVRSTSRPSESASFPSIGALSGLSADGSRIVYITDAPHGPATDTNEAPDVFVRDLTTGTTWLASAQAGESRAGNGVSSEPSFSTDGRWVAFLSTSTNLAGPTGNGAQNVFLRDLTSSNTWLVSRSAVTGLPSPSDCSQPALSPDGRHVAFVSGAALLTEDTNLPRDLYLFDRESGTLQLVTSNVVSGETLAGNLHSRNPRWSPDGRWLVFESHHPALVHPPVADTTPRWHARDMSTGVTLRLHLEGSRNPSESPFGAVFSGDSSTVAFTHIPNIAGSVASVVVRSLIDPSVSNSIAGAQNPRLDRTSRKIAYRVASASGFPSAGMVQVLDRETGRTSPVDTAPDAAPPSARTRSFELDPDGRFVFFTSAATNLHPAARTGHTQLFARDLVAGTTLLLSANAEGQAANSAIGNLILAKDGRTLAFTTFASNLAPTDLNQTADVYLVRFHANAEDEVPVLSIHRANAGASQVTILWSSTPGVRYRAEYKNTLNDTLWTPLAPAEIASVTQSTVQDRILPESPPHRFYRVVRE